MSEFDFTAASLAVTNHERKSGRIEGTYDALVLHLGLTPESDSAELTGAARSIVVTGASADGTATGSTLTEDDLTGRDPGNGPVRTYWKAARAVRKGLVEAIKRANDDTDEESETVVNLLTRAGLKAGLEDVILAWKTANEVNE